MNKWLLTQVTCFTLLFLMHLHIRNQAIDNNDNAGRDCQEKLSINLFVYTYVVSYYELLRKDVSADAISLWWLSIVHALHNYLHTHLLICGVNIYQEISLIVILTFLKVQEYSFCSEYVDWEMAFVSDDDNHHTSHCG